MINAYELALDALTVRVEACEQGKRVSDDVAALKVDIVGLRHDVDEVKSTDLSMLLGTVTLLEVLDTEFPAISEVSSATTTADAARADDDADSEALEIDKKELGVRHITLHDNLDDLEGAMLQIGVEAYLRDTFMVVSC
ncbi:uncharacterized protein LOC125845896 [Solanum stenotomum]|uniref:uncharacterized protein LOC125845896 n=1 Tax=Solanum stenotomum TaxID=172797 RepID=UPI0020CFEBC2|nr:uncharacterized protein LOC125845896 [Solanum stenotomum]